MRNNSFYGAQRGLWAGRYYKIYVDKIGLHGAWLSNEDCEAQLAVAQINGDDGKAWLVRGMMKKAKKREAEYDAMEPGSPAFLAKDKRNFTLRATQWANLNVGANPQPKNFPNRFGILEVTKVDGQKETFGLVGDRKLEDVRQLSHDWLPAIEATPVISALKQKTDEEQRNAEARAVAVGALCWPSAWLVAVAMGISVSWQTHSFLGLACILVVPKLHTWIHIFYSAFFLKDAASAQMRSNRKK